MEEFEVPQPSALKEAALALHEMYVTLIESGFTQYEALIIVANMVKGK